VGGQEKVRRVLTKWESGRSLGDLDRRRSQAEQGRALEESSKLGREGGQQIGCTIVVTLGRWDLGRVGHTAIGPTEQWNKHSQCNGDGVSPAACGTK
jgi:hypothetical protein